ncbi:helix-turn-helix domain-containing protein [Actinoplanes couchii]|uniref:HTH cro/C1-type domain-containing protein n=1 Tax=Actinoplanes couchii TaxID=403638 RepID=A0ABQ3XTG7_9ACTN|nr:helix-turn-helix transcriptional regulator [Actinoplanes couchii]MDR6318963.1 transcriptional regulator with XRE-family HTH domain [Actinoplanes couchii]GID61812.1 hypothetical protein Aco03nite_102160 [Actinoplanes couchii]
MASRRSLLIRRREELGLSQEQLATRIQTDRTTVGRIERGETSPQPHTRKQLSDALQVSPERLTDLLTIDSSKQDLNSPAPPISGGVVAEIHATGATDMYRRNLLRLLSVAATMALLPPHDDLGTAEGIWRSRDTDQLRQLTDSLWQTYGLATNKQLAYPLVEDQLRWLITAIGETRSEAERRTLCVIASELFQLAGEILFDGNFYTDALASYGHAASAAKEGRAYDQWACALVRHGFVSIYDHQYQEASNILDAAVRIADRGDSQLPTRHWVAVVKAQVSASMNDISGCETAFESAQRVTGQRNLMIPGGWLRFDARHLLRSGSGWGWWGQSGPGEVSVDQVVAVLHAFEPVLHRCGESGDGADGVVGQAAFHRRPDLLDRVEFGA